MKLMIDISKDRYDEIMSMDWKNCRRFFDEEIRAIHDGKIVEQEPYEDAISRQAAIDCFTATKLKKFDFILYAREEIKKLPSVTPARKIGRWILTDDDLVYCSECEDSYYPRPIDASWYYCPHCGAKMEEEEDT